MEAVCKASPVRGGGCAGRRRRRGALPLCGGNILQSLAGPCPVFRRGRCLHRPGKPAIPQGLRGGRERPPYIAAGNGRQRGSGSQSPSLATGRCSHRPGTPAIPQGLRGGRERPPYIAAGNGRQRGSGSPPPGPTAGRCKHRPLRWGRRRPCRPMPGTFPSEGHFPQAPARRTGRAPPGKADRIVTRSKISRRLTSHSPKAPLNARWARSFGPARRTPPPSGGGPGCRTPACGRR